MAHASQAAAAAYWFHPLAWFAAARLRREQECSCDDAVLEAGAGAADYAGHLLDMARAIAPSREYGQSPAVGMSGGFDLEQRIRALVDPARSRRTASRKFRAAAALTALALVLPVGSVRAQTQGAASLSGSVYDASGAAVPNASVLLGNSNGSNKEVAQTNDAGQYLLRDIPAGRYSVVVEAPGFKRLQQSGLEIAAGSTATINFTLELGEVRERIQVVGKGPRTVSKQPPHRIRVAATCKRQN